MVNEAQDLQSRLEKLEKENRWLRRLETATVLVVGIAALLATQIHRSHIIEAEQFVLKDSNGKTQGTMVVTPDGPSLVLYDSNQVSRLALSVFKNMPGLTLHGSGKSAAVLGVVPSGPGLQGPESAGLMLYDLEGNPRAQLDAGMEGPRLYLEDEKGFSATVGSYYSSEYPGQKHMAARVILSQKDLGVIWHAP